MTPAKTPNSWINSQGVQIGQFSTSSPYEKKEMWAGKSPHLIGHHSGGQIYPNIGYFVILWYCDPGWDHKPNWIQIYAWIFDKDGPGIYGTTRLATLPRALFFFRQMPNMFGSPTRLTTLPQALCFSRKMAPWIWRDSQMDLDLDISSLWSHGISNQ